MQKWTKVMNHYISYLTNRRPENISVTDADFQFCQKLQTLAAIMDEIEEEAPTLSAPFIVEELNRLNNSPTYQAIQKRIKEGSKNKRPLNRIK